MELLEGIKESSGDISLCYVLFILTCHLYSVIDKCLLRHHILVYTKVMLAPVLFKHVVVSGDLLHKSYLGKSYDNKVIGICVVNHLLLDLTEVLEMRHGIVVPLLFLCVVGTGTDNEDSVSIIKAHTVGDYTGLGGNYLFLTRLKTLELITLLVVADNITLDTVDGYGVKTLVTVFVDILGSITVLCSDCNINRSLICRDSQAVNVDRNTTLTDSYSLCCVSTYTEVICGNTKKFTCVLGIGTVRYIVEALDYTLCKRIAPSNKNVVLLGSYSL